MASPTNPGAGWNTDGPSPGARAAAPANGPASVGGQSGVFKNGVLGVPSTAELDALPGKLTAVVTSINGLTAAVETLTGKLRTLGVTANQQFGPTGNMGSARIAGLGFGGSGNRAVVGGGRTVTTASVTSGGAPSGGGGPSTVTAAPVSGGLGGGAGSALAFGAAGEVASQWAGRINTTMATFQANGMPIDLMARQANAIFGGSNSVGQTINSYTGIANQGPTDLAGAMAAMQANPYLYAAPNSAKQRGLVNFLNASTKLNPSLGAAGAANFANTLASAPALTTFRNLGIGNGALLRPMTGSNPLGMNNPTQAFTAMADVLMGGRRLTTAQMKADAGSSPLATADWVQAQQNNTIAGRGLNLTPAEMNMVRQFMASGGNITQAEKGTTGSLMSSLLGSTTAGTKVQTTVTEETATLQDFINRVSASAKGLTAGFLGLVPGVANVGLAFGTLAKTTLSATSVIAESIAVLRAAPGLGGAVGLGGAGAGAVPAAEAVVGETVAPVAAETAASTVGGSSMLGALGLGGVASKLGLGGGAADGMSLMQKGLLAGGIYMAGSMASGAISGGRPDSLKAGGWRGLAGGVVGGASRDAAIGTMFAPGVGTAIGAGVGAAGALLNGLLPKNDTLAHTILGIIGDPVTGSTTTDGLEPGLRSRVRAMMGANPNIRVTSGARTEAQQSALYALKGGYQVARPGHSLHQQGRAADLGPSSQFGWIAQNAANFGLHTPSSAEPWHVQTMGDPAPSSGGSAGLNSGFLGTVAALGSEYGLGGGGGGGRAFAITPTAATSATTSTTTTAAVSSGSSGPMPKSVAGGSGGYVANPAVVAAVKSVTSNRDVQIAMLMGSALESSQRLDAEGGGGYGPWQIQLSAHPGISAAQAENPTLAARLMVGGGITEGYAAATAAQGSLWNTNPELAAVTAAYQAERPAVPYTQSQTANVAPAFNLALSEVGDPVGTYPTFSRGGSGGGPITLNMPIQVVGVSQQDAQMLAQMVKSALQSQADTAAVSRS